MLLFFSGSDMWACGACGQDVGNSWKGYTPASGWVLLAQWDDIAVHTAAERVTQ